MCIGNLASSAIHQNKLGQRLPLSHQSGVAPCNHLIHCCIIIWANYALYVKNSVVPLAWLAALEDHTSPYRVCALNVGVVEALYMNRKLFKVQRLLQSIYHTHSAALRLRVLYLLLL